MNYTKTIRNYCLQNKGDLFDVSYMKDSYFEMIPYKTLLKIINRLEDERILTCVAKGVYLINDEDTVLDDAIIRRYIADSRGMFVGNTMFNDLGITQTESDVIEVYTNRLTVDHKTIDNYQLTRVDIPFTETVEPIVMLLECIENGYKLQDISIIQLRNAVDELAERYSDQAFTVICGTMKYQYSTIITLKELLDQKGISNTCKEIFERYNK